MGLRTQPRNEKFCTLCTLFSKADSNVVETLALSPGSASKFVRHIRLRTSFATAMNFRPGTVLGAAKVIIRT